MEKIAAEGGQLEAYYIEAEKMASEHGIDPQDALLLAADALATKVATHVMLEEIEQAGHQRAEAMAYETADAYTKAAAAYAPPSGAYAGIQNVIDDRLAAR